MNINKTIESTYLKGGTLAVNHKGELVTACMRGKSIVTYNIDGFGLLGNEISPFQHTTHQLIKTTIYK